jgi:hypothetical protein
VYSGNLMLRAGVIVESHIKGNDIALVVIIRMP